MSWLQNTPPSMSRDHKLIPVNLCPKFVQRVYPIFAKLTAVVKLNPRKWKHPVLVGWGGLKSKMRGTRGMLAGQWGSTQTEVTVNVSDDWTTCLPRDQ